jgi:hypothetical protein
MPSLLFWCWVTKILVWQTIWSVSWRCYSVVFGFSVRNLRHLILGPCLGWRIIRDSNQNLDILWVAHTWGVCVATSCSLWLVTDADLLWGSCSLSSPPLCFFFLAAKKKEWFLQLHQQYILQRETETITIHFQTKPDQIFWSLKSHLASYILVLDKHQPHDELLSVLIDPVTGFSPFGSMT